MKRGMLLVLLCLLALLAMSCTTTTSVGIVFDESLPEEKTAQLILSNTGNITSYNDIAVDWKLFDMQTVKIPAGNTILIWNIKNYFYRGKNLIFAYNFKPQKKYLFVVKQKEETTGMDVHEYELEEAIHWSEKDLATHFVEFVKFLNVRGAGETLILN